LTLLNETILPDTPPSECTIIEEVGSTGMGAITIAFLIFIVATIIFVIKAYGCKEQRRYYFLATYICGFASMAYFSMLSGEGWMAVTGCRQFFYARYVESLITCPLLILLLGAVSGAEFDVISAAVGSSVIFVVTGLLGTVTAITGVKWVWFILSVVGIVGVLLHFAKIFKEAADAKGSEVAQLYGKLAFISTYSWAGYLIVWLFSVGFDSFSVSFEVCAYALLDVFAKAVVCFVVLSGHDALGAGAGGEAGAAESQQFV